MSEIVAVVCGVIAIVAIVLFERSIRHAAESRVDEVRGWSSRALEDVRREADSTRAWFSEELRLAREENGRLTRLLESRNLAEFTSAEEQLARARGVRVPAPEPRKPSAIEEMWGNKPPVDTGKERAS